jgi:hypothetical protein
VEFLVSDIAFLRFKEESLLQAADLHRKKKVSVNEVGHDCGLYYM